ncbi:MAG: class IV adenylate cyclase [Anaerolineaceae bacterium]|nr:class IV adenylate cyclase [Anaerolineaceae bacterium]
MNDTELEVKFYLSDLPGLEKRLISAGARLQQARLRELNLRFDTREGSLNAAHQVLRLRQDQAYHLTFKGPAASGEEVSMRKEIEFEVSDFWTARRFLEALGFMVSISYDKYRTTYEFSSTMVTLDEMPIGNFAEVEGRDAETIRAVAEQLGLNWEARSLMSYLGLFDRVKQKLGLSARNLTFEELSGQRFSGEDLELKAADA